MTDRFMIICYQIESYLYLMRNLRAFNEELKKYDPILLSEFKYNLETTIHVRRFISYMLLKGYKFKTEHVKTAFDKFILHIIKKSIRPFFVPVEGQTYIIERVRSYVTYEISDLIIWIFMCISYKLELLKKENKKCIPDSLYLYTMSDLELTDEDSVIFRHNFGKNYKNLFRIMLGTLGDLAHDIESERYDQTKEGKNSKDNEEYFYRFLRYKMNKCRGISNYMDFLQIPYIQLLLMSTL